MATNRFTCEVCGKGFQRDQNLQLHRRGHNLPWKLKQRSSSESLPVKKKVYVCPEVSCAHHNPTRALGDLTGIKKHYSRKHGEKKWKCEKCSKKYAVHSDWKAHIKICGTREYRCDCGTLFARRDSFITHRAFCDALAEETARSTTNTTTTITKDPSASSHQFLLFSQPSTTMAPPPVHCDFPPPTTSIVDHQLMQNDLQWLPSDFIVDQRYHSALSRHLSATALLQKAAQMGATISSSNSSQLANMDVASLGPHAGALLGSTTGLKRQRINEEATSGVMREGTTRDFLGLRGVELSFSTSYNNSQFSSSSFEAQLQDKKLAWHHS